MTSKETCPNQLVFSSYASGVVLSYKEWFDHIMKWFDNQLIDNVCPKCLYYEICMYKEELLANLRDADTRRKNAIVQ